jgi:hypothetical protein
MIRFCLNRIIYVYTTRVKKPKKIFTENLERPALQLQGVGKKIRSLPR